MFSMITVDHEINLKISLKYINTEKVNEKEMVTAIWKKKKKRKITKI